MHELEALRAADFDWVSHIEGIWADPLADVPEIHRKVRDDLSRRIDLLAARAASPLGVPVLGEAGAGKTHLLSALRQAAFAKGAGFILIDMTDVNDFWATAQLGFLNSLRRPGPTGNAQYVEILEYALSHHVGQGSGLVDAEKLRALPADTLADRTGVMVSELVRRFPQAMAYRDAIRALALHNSSHFDLASIGYNWLQGLGIDPADKVRFGFAQDHIASSQVLRSLAWLFSLKGPVVVALDQLDAMVAEHHVASGPRSDDPSVAERQQRSLAIIEGIASGLLALRDITQRALIVPACLEGTWSVLRTKAIASALDRYDAPLLLHKPDKGEVLRKIVAGRLRPAFRDHGVAPPYESWPFAPPAFVGLQLTPRELLKRCSRHVGACVDLDRILELSSFSEPAPQPVLAKEPDLAPFDQRYREAQAGAEVDSLKREEEEAALDRLLDVACSLLVFEQNLPEGKDAEVDRDFPRTGKLEPLHTRIRLIHRDEGDREEHFSFRILVHDHPIAFQSRLNAAITAAGIDRALDFRKLRILRFTPVPGGKRTQDAVAKLRAHGGEIVCPSDGDLRAMRALAALAVEPHDADVDRWLRSRKPATALGLFGEVRAWLLSAAGRPHGAPSTPSPSSGQASPASRAPAAPAATSAPGTRDAGPRPTPPPEGSSPPASTSAPAEARVARPVTQAGPSPVPSRSPAEMGSIPIGARIVAGLPTGEILRIPLEQLKRHTVVLAGAGSGKTVLVRRIVEEAALVGIPSIVVDIANDLATFGDRWPVRPNSFDDEDDAGTERFFAATETIVWTPGRADGNPLRMEPLPNLSALVASADEYAIALDLARAALEAWALPPTGAGRKERAGVLQSALDWYARSGRSGLGGFIDVLTDLPPEAAGGYDKADKLARAMADKLRAEVQMNPLLRKEGVPLDPAVLFGDAANTHRRTRISVVNLQGLPSPDMQQDFVAQLAALLFSWIKAHPTPPGRPLRGLVVIDEAKDLVPSIKRTPSGDNLVRLANQARKYGLGLVFATQAPKSIDHNVIANCATQFYGRAASPAALDVIRDQLRARGAPGDDAATLTKGRFYAYSEGFAAPIKIATRLSLSYHPTNPLDEAGILERAARVRVG